MTDYFRGGWGYHLCVCRQSMDGRGVVSRETFLLFLFSRGRRLRKVKIKPTDLFIFCMFLPFFLCFILIFIWGSDGADGGLRVEVLKKLFNARKGWNKASFFKLSEIEQERCSPHTLSG